MDRFASPYVKTWRSYQDKLLHLQNTQTVYKIILFKVVMQRVWTVSVQRTICSSAFWFLMNLSKLRKDFKWYMEIKVINLMSYFFPNRVILW